MNYQRLHDAIIADSRLTSPIGYKHRNAGDNYKEKHHIVPRCVGGSNDLDNLVYLTARRHFIIHRLLTKIYPNNPKIWYAFRMMFMQHNKLNRKMDKGGWNALTSKLYNECKIKCNSMQVGVKLTALHKLNISLARKQVKPKIKIKYKHSNEMRDQISRTTTSKFKIPNNYIVIDKNDAIYTFSNIRRFCSEHNLDRRNLGKLLNGILKTHKGFRIPQVSHS